MTGKINIIARASLAVAMVLALLFSPLSALALTVEPSTWNVIGLKSNDPAAGPYRFPVGAKVCGGTPGTSRGVTFSWEAGGSDDGTYINLRPGSDASITVIYGDDGCADAFFEVEVERVAAAFYQSRRYYITAGGVSTPRPRELYVEQLISQSRNSITDVKVDGVSIPAGGSMSLIVGNTYTISLYGGTATQGYNQFEKFINFPNTIFQVLAVSTDYSANNSPYVTTSGHEYLYADACGWENDPNSPNYLSCVGGDYKAGGSDVVTTYTVKIVSGGGSSEILSTLLYDLSGASYHYNADYSTSWRVANIIDPADVDIAKSFAPGTIKAGGVSTLTFRISNPNPGVIGGLNFSDTFPSGMVVADPAGASSSCGGTVTANPGDGSISFADGTAPANGGCTVKVNVTAPDEATYTNTSGNLFVDTLDTGNFASADLTVDDSFFPPPTPPSSCPGQEVTLASWNFTTSTAYTTKQADVAHATATFGGTGAISSGVTAGYWWGRGWLGDDSLAPPTSAQTYFEFDVDTSKYGGAFIEFRPSRDGQWTGNAAKNLVRVHDGTDGADFSNLADYTGIGTNWNLLVTHPAAATGPEKTVFRIQGYYVNKTKTATAEMLLDDVAVKGCALPETPPDPPTISKGFSPDPVAVGGTSTLSFTVTNPNAGDALSGISFSDTLPEGLTVADGSSSQCGGTLTTAAPDTISLAGGTLAASSSCEITATITATDAGTHDNVSGFVSASESGANSGAGGIASASLTVLAPPEIAKQFAPDSILAGDKSTLTFRITNPNRNNALSGVAFTDNFPAGMRVADSATSSTDGCGTPTFTPVADEASITFANGTIVAGGTCTVSVEVTATASGDNTSGNISHILNGTWNGNTAAATLTVTAPNPMISLLKQVSTSAGGPWSNYVALPAGDDLYYRFTVENPGDVDLAGVAVSDPDLGGPVADCARPTLAKYEEITCATAGPVTASAGANDNTATATGNYGATPVADTSTATYATTKLTLVKNVTQSYFTAAGNELNYSFTLTNSGYATLPGPVTITDDKAPATCPALATLGNNDNFFNPGEEITCTATYTTVAGDVTARQVTNEAYATTPEYGGSAEVRSNTASRSVPLAADLTAAKSNDTADNKVTLGGSFTWTLTVSNTLSAGTAIFANGQVILTDNLPDSGATYVAGAVTKAGTTGTITCAIAAGTLTCTADGEVVLPYALTGTIAVENASAPVTGTGTKFTEELTAGSIIRIADVYYQVEAIASDTQLTLAAAYAGETAAGLEIPGSFSITVTVETTASGELANPKSGGICRADPDGVLPEIDDANNDCADTVTVLAMPSITLVKTVQTFSDPVHGETNPYAIPGAVMRYTILSTNTGFGSTDADSVILTDQIPTQTDLVATGSPVIFIDGEGAQASGLTFSAATDVIYYDASDNSVTPTADVNGVDPAVRKIVITPQGTFLASDGVDNPMFSIVFYVRVR